MTQEQELIERAINTEEANVKRVQGAVLASAAHLATQRFQGWANPIVASCKDASDMIAAQQAEISALRAQLDKAREVKPLKWWGNRPWKDELRCFDALVPWGKYEIRQVEKLDDDGETHRFWVVDIPAGLMGDIFENLDEAKVAAQADYQRRYNAMSQEGE